MFYLSLGKKLVVSLVPIACRVSAVAETPLRQPLLGDS